MRGGWSARVVYDYPLWTLGPVVRRAGTDSPTQNLCSENPYPVLKKVRKSSRHLEVTLVMGSDEDLRDKERSHEEYRNTTAK